MVTSCRVSSLASHTSSRRAAVVLRRPIQIFLVVSSLLAQLHQNHAWVLAPTRQSRHAPTTTKSTRHASSGLAPLSDRRSFGRDSSVRLRSSSVATAEDYEYVEYEILKEEDFAGSEWLVGTNWDNNPNDISETWVRLAVDSEGQNVAIWGDNSQGKWALDVASQFLSISKESLLGKQIWACTTDDYYYLQGTVRGWNYWKAASVLGQWQAKRLGVDPEEAGTAPWFESESTE